MVRFVQLICIGFDLCIEGTQVLAGGVVYINVILRASWLIIVIERRACYQLVGNRSIRRRGVCTCSERTCTKSLAPGVFAAVLGRCCSIACVFDRFVVLIKLHVAILICLINFDIITHIRSILQLFHDDDIVIFNTIGDFDQAIIGSRIVFGFFYCRRLGIIIESAICVP